MARRVAWIVGLAVAAWIAAGVRWLDPATEFCVVTGPLVRGGVSVREHQRLVVAPPGLYGRAVFPRRTERLPLPDAAHAMLPGADGSRYGLIGTAEITALPDHGRELAAAAAGQGLARVLLSASRAAASVFDGADREDRGVSTRRLAFERRLADELLAAYRREGVAITKRENVHRMADANKAFAHFAW